MAEEQSLDIVKKAKQEAEEQSIETHKELDKNDAVRAGWKMFGTAEEDAVRQNVLCQSIALSAGSTSIFFAAFIEFASQLIEMKGEQAKAMEDLKEKAIDAYKNAYVFSIEYGKVLVTLGMFENQMDAILGLMDIAVLTKKPLPAETFNEALGVPELMSALDNLQKGASHQVSQAMNVVGKAMKMQSEGATWREWLDQEQEAGLVFRRAEEAFFKGKSNTEFMKTEGTLLAIQGKIKIVDEEVKAKERLKQQNAAERDKLFQEVKALYMENSNDAIGMQKKQRIAWDEQNKRQLKEAEMHVAACQKVVDAGGYKHTVDSVVHETMTTGWWIFTTNYQVPRKVKKDEYDMKGAGDSLRAAQARQDLIKNAQNPFQGSPPEPKMPVWDDFKGDSEAEYCVIRDLNAQIQDLKGEQKALEIEVSDNQQQVERLRKIMEEEKEKWVNAQDKLNKEFGDVGPGYTLRVIKAYQAGMMIQEAMALLGFAETMGVCGLSRHTTMLKHLLLTSGEVPDVQGQKTAVETIDTLVRKKNNEFARCVQWIGKIGGSFAPLPLPRGVTEASMKAAVQWQLEDHANKSLEDHAKELENLEITRIPALEDQD